jgi:ring-1,2-phenylacetyl-CoA epoxidase subunit PaaE
MGTKKSNIHFELFNTAGATAEVKAKTSSKASANAKVTVVLDGEETHFEMGPKDYVLVDDEVKDGYILTCQTHATSDELVISFDE